LSETATCKTSKFASSIPKLLLGCECVTSKGAWRLCELVNSSYVGYGEGDTNHA
jgi:hypothetical protein